MNFDVFIFAMVIPRGSVSPYFCVQALQVVFVNEHRCETTVLKQNTKIFCPYHSSFGDKTPLTQMFCQDHLSFEALMPLMQHAFPSQYGFAQPRSESHSQSSGLNGGDTEGNGGGHNNSGSQSSGLGGGDNQGSSSEGKGGGDNSGSSISGKGGGDMSGTSSQGKGGGKGTSQPKQPMSGSQITTALYRMAAFFDSSFKGKGSEDKGSSKGKEQRISGSSSKGIGGEDKGSSKGTGGGDISGTSEGKGGDNISGSSSSGKGGDNHRRHWVISGSSKGNGGGDNSGSSKGKGGSSSKGNVGRAIALPKPGGYWVWNPEVDSEEDTAEFQEDC